MEKTRDDESVVVSLQTGGMNGASGYARMSLLDLARCVVESGDACALGELLEHRRIFRWTGGGGLLLAEYVARLRDRALDRRGTRNAYEVADNAYDLTIDKFSNLPSPKKETSSLPRDDGNPVEQSGIDCRNYYRAFLHQCSARPIPDESQLECEAMAAWTLQKLVVRHFYLSRAEAVRRADPHIHRYFWRVKGKDLCLYMPRSMTGAEKREWLEKNIEAPDPDRPNERMRIQAVIDERLLGDRTVVFHEGIVNAMGGTASPALPWAVEHEVSVKGLAETLAEEKAANIAGLRPSIRALRKTMLKTLIKDIFEMLRRGRYDEGSMAGEYGLSKSSFSRFCGSQWAQACSEAERRAIPDLWANLAELLAHHSAFVEAAQAAGVWDSVQEVLQTLRPEETEEKPDAQ